VLALLKHGAKVDAQDRVDGSLPIHFACQLRSNGTAQVLQHLMTFGADPYARTGVVGPRDTSGTPKPDPSREELQGGRTPLMIAAHEGNTEALEVILGLLSTGKDHIDSMDVSGQTSVTFAAIANQVPSLNLLLNAGAAPNLPGADGRAALHHAAYYGAFDTAKALVKFGGFDVDQPAALTNGAGQGHTAMLIASFQGHDKIVRLLLKHGASPNRGAKDGATPLIAASSGGHKKIVKALLKAGADPRRRLESGETAAIVAANRDIATFLYEAEYELRMGELDGDAESIRDFEHFTSDDEEDSLDVAGEDGGAHSEL